MRYAEPDAFAALVKKVAGPSSLSSNLTGVDVEAGDIDDEGRCFRVLIHLKGLENLSEDDADSTTSLIEGAVAAQDDRTPRIRLSKP